MTRSVAIVMGSDSDLPNFETCFSTLKDLGIPFEVRILSAHRTPDLAAQFAKDAEKNGAGAIIAGAGGAAHLAGAMAAHSILPIIGVPIAATPLAGFDSLLSTAQMPPGIPVATVAVGAMGATNAAWLAAQILSLSDPALRARLESARAKMREKVAAKDREVREKYGSR